MTEEQRDPVPRTWAGPSRVVPGKCVWGLAFLDFLKRLDLLPSLEGTSLNRLRGTFALYNTYDVHFLNFPLCTRSFSRSFLPTSLLSISSFRLAAKEPENTEPAAGGETSPKTLAWRTANSGSRFPFLSFTDRRHQAGGAARCARGERGRFSTLSFAKMWAASGTGPPVCNLSDIV